MRHFLAGFGTTMLRHGMFLLIMAAGMAPSVASADTVDDIRRILLAISPEEQAKPSPEVLEYRRENLQKKIDQLEGIPELRRTLALEDWKLATAAIPGSKDIISNKIVEIDVGMRKQVGVRLTKEIQTDVEKGNDNRKLAAAVAIAEIGPTIGSLDPTDKGGFARSLTPELIKLVHDKNVAVQEQALRALGTINAKPQEAAPVMKGALESAPLGPKLQAAYGLGQMVNVVSFLRPTATGLLRPAFTDNKDVVDTIAAIIPANSPGLKDADPRVRAAALRNVKTASEALSDLIGPEVPDVMPPEGLRLSATEQKRIRAWHDRMAGELQLLQPDIDALREQAPSLVLAMEDSDLNVRLGGAEALESIGNARLRLKKRVHSVPGIPGDPDGGDMGNRAVLKKTDMLGSFIEKDLGLMTKLLADGDVRLRRKAAEFFDIIEEAAEPVVSALARSLSDSDRYVRWTAARAIGNIAEHNAEKAAVGVPGLERLLADSDTSVRIAAAKALKEIGKLAGAAAPGLAQAVGKGDAESRLAAMEALRALGPEHSKVAVPQLIECLKHSDPRVKRLAARTLGTVGPAAAAALPALRMALGDNDSEFRTNAADAILEIVPRKAE